MAGFTLVELATTLVLGSILMGITIASFARVRAQLSTRSAQTQFMGLHAQARAFSVERGVDVILVVDETTDRATVLRATPSGPLVLRQVDFRNTFGVDLVTGQGSVNLCFTPRGTANPSCAGTFAGTSLEVRFVVDGRSHVVTVFPLGQAREG
jgi:prepilin-type N-terminal cleavage/methylation domain-containing protein